MLAGMQNPFLIVRFVLFALMLITSILSLSFASWNIHATSAAEVSLSAVTILLVFTSCLTIICIILALLELPFPRVRASWIMFECIWAAVLSVFQIGAAIGITVDFAMLGQAETDPAIRVSTTLLVPTTWFSCFTLFTFFSLFFISALTHRRQYDDIWNHSPYDIHWFSQGAAHDKHTLRPGSETKTRPAVDSWARFMNDAEWCPPKHRPAPIPPTDNMPWAKQQPARRGVDMPFATRPETTTPLRVPGKVTSQQTAAQTSRFIERFRESRILSRPGSLSTIDHSRVAQFPPAISDHDLPIPLPRRSEWFRADAITSRH
ncbi:hypothetical protein BDN72DRAFT_831131 [Pluteus cervinus]|uniref:Uncharacterized protein n=1 Tax=Pluteus cervinus TaxID=181527 RepID=A0ACD3BET1_9AGAR|nr:hypothetical protein BDN72DRAFT_831131 [Pluteus cervinus]